MMILKFLWKSREILYVLTIVALGWFLFDGDPDFRGVVDGSSSTVVVESPGLAGRTIATADRADKPKGIGERIGTKELIPDTVYVSPGVAPREVPAEPLDLPEWGIAEVDIDGRSLTVSALNHSTGAASKAVFTLGSRHPKLTVRSGNVPHSVREGRNFRGPLRFGIRATGFGGVDLNTGAPAVGGILEGPVGVKLGMGKLAPAAVVGFGEGLKLGGTYTIEFGDL